MGISVEELKAANSLTGNLLTIGQKLIIPKKTEIEDSEEFDIYIVKSGDSLYTIANNFKTTVDDLISYNNLSSTTLNIGQQILIPKQQMVYYQTYKVKSGDTLYSIANKYNVTVNEIKNINNLTNNVLSIGQTLLIPRDNETNTYTVQVGDTLYSIARKYNTTETEIKNLNNLTSNLLNIGQKLIIPTQTSTNTYVVKSGDNLYSIARQYNTTVNEIKNKNNLTSNILSIGQILII